VTDAPEAESSRRVLRGTPLVYLRPLTWRADGDRPEVSVAAGDTTIAVDPCRLTGEARVLWLAGDRSPSRDARPRNWCRVVVAVDRCARFVVLGVDVAVAC
jgi:hypothetical protein